MSVLASCRKLHKGDGGILGADGCLQCFIKCFGSLCHQLLDTQPSVRCRNSMHPDRAHTVLCTLLCTAEIGLLPYGGA